MILMKAPTQALARLSRRWGPALLCAVALALPATAFGGEPTKRDKPAPGPGDAGMSIGDETIGTLPIWNTGGLLELHRGLPILRPSLYLEGDLYELQNLIAWVGGSARAEVVPLDANWQRVRLVFVDQVLLAMDRLTVQGTDVQFGLWMPQSTAQLQPLLTFGERQFALPLPEASRLALPIRELSISGALEGSPLRVECQSPLGPGALLAGANQDFLLLAQRQ